MEVIVFEGDKRQVLSFKKVSYASKPRHFGEFMCNDPPSMKTVTPPNR
jgi:hypothetical protein